MAGRPKRAKVRAALEARAKRHISDDATALDYVEDFLASGGDFQALARELTVEMGEAVSRKGVSDSAHSLADDASDRIAAARQAGAAAIVEQAQCIADEAEPTSGAVQKAKTQVNVRLWRAERLDPQFTSKQHDVHISLNALMLEALRQPPPPPPTLRIDAAARVLSIPTGSTQVEDADVLD